MKVELSIPSTLTALLVSACASTAPDPMVLVENERAFAAAVAEHGINDGFLQFLSEDAVMFVPQMVNGREHYEEQPPSPARLSWSPIYAEIAGSGDMGFTTGPWELRMKEGDADPAVSGHYTTVWTLQAEEGWKCVIDIGVAHGPHGDGPLPPELRVLHSSGEVDDVAGVREGLWQLEEELSSDSRERGVLPAYRDRVAEDVRFYRMGVFPRQGVACLAEVFDSGEGEWSWIPTSAEVSLDGSLGYVFGEASLGEARLTYFRIWRKEERGPWRIALDVHLPL